MSKCEIKTLFFAYIIGNKKKIIVRAFLKRGLMARGFFIAHDFVGFFTGSQKR